MNKIAKTLGAVHTHTHTRLLNKRFKQLGKQIKK